MKKVLIVSYFYPPRPGIASVRIGGLTKYLHKFEWEPIVLTPTINKGIWPPYAKVFETDFCSSKDRLKKMFLNGNIKDENSSNKVLDKQGSVINSKSKTSVIAKKVIDEVIMYPDEYKTWINTAVKKSIEVINNENISAIISSSVPVSTHIIASKVVEEAKIPWIADFRDLWTQNHYYKYSNCRLFFERKLELKTMKNSSALVTVSEDLANDLKKLHKGKKVYCIKNGFDHEELRKEDVSTNKFTITYTGYLYDLKRNPTLLIEAISELLQEGKIHRQDIEVRFYGPYEQKLENVINHHTLGDVVIQYGNVSRDESIEIQRESTILLMLNWDNDLEKGVYTGKIFEYLAARRPILALGGPGGVVKQLIEETKAGVHLKDKDKIKDYIFNSYKEYKLYGSIRVNQDINEIYKYSHLNMASSFSNILNELVMKK